MASGRPKFRWRRVEERGGERREDEKVKTLKVLLSQIKEGTDGGGLVRSIDSRLEAEGR